MSSPSDVTGPSRIGLLGGTFDPPHHGHLAAAEAARDAFGLDRVVLVVANDPWQKTGGGESVSAVEVRLAMVRAAVADRTGAEPWLEVDDLEVRRGGPSYTADTVVEYCGRHPGADLFVLVGSDVAPSLGSWVRTDEFRRRATIVVMERPGHEGRRPPPGWEHEVLDGVFPDLAGRELRATVATGVDLQGSVPPGVATLIVEHGLYGIGR